MKRALLLCVLLAGCATDAPREALPPPPAAPIFDALIVPGQRIGPISIGMTGAQLLQVAGSPVRSMRFGDATSIDLANGVSVMVRDSDNRVYRMLTTDPRYATKEGVRVGMSEFEARTRIGPPSGVTDAQSTRSVCYRDLTFGVDTASNLLTAISVSPGYYCSGARR